jgi:hypothetical protein
VRTGPTITLARKTGSAAFLKRMAGLTKLAAYVGVPAAASKARSDQLLEMAGGVKGKRKKAQLQKALLSDVTNAELLFIHTKGSPINNIPARPVIEPAVAADGNQQAIAHEIQGSIKAQLGGDGAKSVQKMKRAALAGQNAARKWFTDPRNNWAPNKPATIAAKGSDRPLINTGALRASIVGIVAEE